MRKNRNWAPDRHDVWVVLIGSCAAVLLAAVLALSAYMLLSPKEERVEPSQPPEETPSAQTEQTEALPEPTQAPEEPTQGEPEEFEEKAQQLLQTMTQEEKIYQLFIVRQEAITGCDPVVESGEITREAISKYPVGGIVYFAKNIRNRVQCQTMISNIQSYSKLGLFISVDEEGARISRIAKNPEMGTTVFDSMLTIGASENAGEKAYEVGKTIGAEIAQLGFNLDFAPVADVFSNPANTVIGDRAFSTDPEIAAELVAQCVKGFGDSGMLCTLKHFPGHGDTAQDSHYSTAITTKTVQQLRECELLPFRAGIDAGAPFVMVGHVTVPDISERPASLSHEVVTGLLREELGFDGLVITDAMDMDAITNSYTSSVAAVLALQAGADIILMPENLVGAVEGVKNALETGELTQEQIDEKVLRILKVKLEAGIIPEE